MTQQLSADVTTLDSIVSKLTATAQAFGDLSPGVPRSVSASAGSAAVAAIVQHLVTNAANLCGELETTCTGVRQSRSAYDTTDDSTCIAMHTVDGHR